MKKIIVILLGIACVSASVMAQHTVRIGNMEFVVKKTERDTVTQVVEDKEPCPPCPPVNNNQTKTKFSSYQKTYFFGGVSAVYPENGSGDYYTVLGGKSFNIDAGWIHCNAITRWLALGGTFQYSFYNYNLRDAASDTKFADEVIGSVFATDDIRKQEYRSHNISASAFTRLYLTNHQSRRVARNRIYLDFGVQGDFVLYKFCMLNTHSEGKKRYHNDYAFNPFTASAIARVGFGNGWAFFARYRLTDAFNQKEKVLLMDLPPLSIGIHFL